MSKGILLLYLQIIRILNRLVVRILYQAGIASEGICNDYLFLFHNITFLYLCFGENTAIFPPKQQNIIAFFRTQ